MRHIEFIHDDHFENNYYRVPPPSALSTFVDFFWETNFEELWNDRVRSFSDAQFPNLGYTYIINLGNSFSMQVDDQRQKLTTDGFLPRYHAIESFHKPGDHLFGIKFRISPVIFQKKIDFSEYRGYIFPLSYLLDVKVIAAVKNVIVFEERVNILSKYFISLLGRDNSSIHPVHIVSEFLDECISDYEFGPSLEKYARKRSVSSRTLQRYFQSCTGISAKKALQVIRIRKAIADLVSDKEGFDHTRYGYYDHSHFYKHLRKFLSWNTFGAQDLHLKLLA